MPKFGKGHINSEKFMDFEHNQVIYSSSTISWPRFKLLDKFKMPKFAKGHTNSEKFMDFITPEKLIR